MHKDLFAVPIIIPQNKDLDQLHLETERKKRDIQRKFLMKDDLVAGRTYYDPSLEPPELPDPNPIKERMDAAAA